MRTERTQENELEEVFNFQGNPISMRMVDGSVYVNLTEMAKMYPRKNLSHIVQSKEMKEYIQALGEIQNCSSADYLTVTKGGDVNTQGTWAYSKVALRVAQKLDPKFSVWVDTKVEELFSKGQTRISTDSQQAQGYDLYARKLEAAKFLYQVAGEGQFTELYSQIIRTKAVNMAADENILPMPESPRQEKRVGAAEMGRLIAEELTLDEPLSANMVGKVARFAGLKNEENGILIEDTTPTGRQIQTFEYYPSSLQRFVKASIRYACENRNSKLASLMDNAGLLPEE